ncbi:unnamed protein product [Citrullus colocynthis]|uniref:Uncharacterized protein n=1 Tax=Citrullus colocynthis TaxID=252529 RepID=A0ABP0YYJ6_9ROSI
MERSGCVKRGEWENVIRSYINSIQEAQFTTKVTEEGDTALHCAFYDGQEKVAEELDEQLVDIKNQEDETPLFLAAISGNNHAHNNTIRHLFPASDKNGNTPLHLAAADRGHAKNPWRVTGPALQLQSEIKWYQMVEDSNESKFFVQYNKDKKLAKTIFDEAHTRRCWKVVGSGLLEPPIHALIATLAFASATTVPGGNGEDGSPALERKTRVFNFCHPSLLSLPFASPQPQLLRFSQSSAQNSR